MYRLVVVLTVTILVCVSTPSHLGCTSAADGVSPVMTATARAEGAPPAEVVLEVKTLVNTIDGSERCGCGTINIVDVGKAHALWITFGKATPHTQDGWEPGARSTHCGSGSFEDVSSHFGKTVGTPYMIVDFSVTPGAEPAGALILSVLLRIRTLASLDKSRKPIYTSRTDNRNIRIESAGAVTLPLLVGDPVAEEAFAVHEVLLRLSARILRQEASLSYGSISVTSDMPGAQIFLGGAFVGTISEEHPTLVTNVVAGMTEVSVRDFSERGARKAIVVDTGRTAEVAFKILPGVSAMSPSDLIPVGSNPQGHEEYWRAKDGALVVRVPAGDFLMGSPEGEGEPRERPQRGVRVPEFLIDKTEVTWRQYRKFAERTGSPLPPAPISGSPDDYPVSNVLWKEAHRYCEWVGGRLPTEAEWEKAARGTNGQKYPWGEHWDPLRCNSWMRGPKRPVCVGSYPDGVSPYGVMDMAGSMWEWCASWYRENNDPNGSTPTRRVLRGGSWISQSLWVRAAYRHSATPTSRNVHNGFRCVLDVQE